ncbi:cobyrinate a,c-diamide synthase [Silvibacterium dinghuense]|uniref:Cobyrinate a,c-diamide synthase n=1 Tax=Silvibacterium dinghuense TaxID=1560006 RepID=A0A4V1NUT2_9BACT|nr:cobyrinate a,c-diamide synthase [Silvibacterium dinghuense]RXS93328.1 cobyrinate a,c-diamide synthase [Silvibacterium dinghuense]GGH04934.1 cobyrinate a,c-diamide synthase [Silvibacterium dinghuense]
MIAFMVAGTGSGVGKTTLALALMAAFRERGQVVQPFKCGPDFLDTGHHMAICGRTSRNLDTWMLPAEANRELFDSACRDADVAIVEGMMGLFDGKSGEGERGSAAEIAKLLDLPVVLVLDAAKSARSIAAVVKGFESFDPQLRFAGIVLNGVSSEGHDRILQAAIKSISAIPLLGRFPQNPALAIPERHLGLRTAEEETDTTDRSARFAEAAHRYLDLAPLLKLSHPQSSIPMRAHRATLSDARIGVARDKAFSFYYEDNFDLLRECGAEIVPFSPLSDSNLPPALDALYLGGGYPELHAEQLIANQGMTKAIRNFAESGRPMYAECGGMIYLSQSLTTLDGHAFSMAGVLPLAFEMTSKLVQFGYVDLEFTEDCLLGPQGLTMRGHSFHYSRLKQQDTLPTSYRVQYSLSGQTELEGFRYRNILASYIHLHFRSNPALPENFLHTIRHIKANL